MAGTKGSISSMDQRGKEKDKKGILENLRDAATSVPGMLGIGAAGAAAQVISKNLSHVEDVVSGGFTGALQSIKDKAESLRGAPAPTPVPRSDQLGAVSAKYESGGRGVETVSSGKGDPGGVSYGSHQLASKTGTMRAFLKSSEGQPFSKSTLEE
jgi:hypothetical protein